MLRVGNPFNTNFLYLIFEDYIEHLLIKFRVILINYLYTYKWFEMRLRVLKGPIKRAKFVSVFCFFKLCLIFESFPK